MAQCSAQLVTAQSGDLSLGIPQIRRIGQRFASEWGKELLAGRANPATRLRKATEETNTLSSELRQRISNTLEQNDAAVTAFKTLSVQTDMWTAQNVQNRISEIRAALSHAESCRDACAALLAQVTACAKEARSARAKVKRASDKDSVQRLREYEQTRLPAAWRSLIRDLALLPSAEGKFPNYTPSSPAKKGDAHVDWTLPAWWHGDDNGAPQCPVQCHM